MSKVKRALLLLSMLIPMAAQQANHSVVLIWKWAQGTGWLATGFHVQRSDTAGGPYTVVGTVSVASLTFTDATP